MTNYAVGRNIPGYLPEGDVFITDDYEAARSALVEDLDRYADDLYEMGGGLASDDALSDVDAVNALEHGTEWYGVLPTSDSPHDLGLAFWLSETDEPVSEDDD